MKLKDWKILELTYQFPIAIVVVLQSKYKGLLNKLIHEWDSILVQGLSSGL